ncbi:hypothetical protein AV521_03470 [Streptomyces sp. IMTB 2501]|nr:hypothetical protein AV521_03470 [Streptomyces sp. IMTB 2501]
MDSAYRAAHDRARQRAMSTIIGEQRVCDPVQRERPGRRRVDHAGRRLRIPPHLLVDFDTQPVRAVSRSLGDFME